MFIPPIPLTNKVVKLEMTDGSKPRYAIQLEDGSFYGQSWDGNTRTYPTWTTKRAANKAFEKLKLKEH